MRKCKEVLCIIKDFVKFGWRIFSGLPMVYLGVFLLAVKFFLIKGTGNVLSVFSVFLIAFGILLYVRRLKKESAY